MQRNAGVPSVSSSRETKASFVRLTANGAGVRRTASGCSGRHAAGCRETSKCSGRARPEDVPPWAQQGNFRFIRIDGGQIESWKAERTWWGQKFSAEEKDALTHIYDSEFEQMLDLLKQADFNWIWVTWSNGWSLKDEDENRENLKKVIARCHENGIHVSAYLSASNMFWKSAYRDDPET